MSKLHEVKKLKEDNPGAWATLRGNLAETLNKNNDGKCTKVGVMKTMKAAKKKAKR